MGGNCVTREEARQLDDRLDEILAEVRKIHGAFPRTNEGETDFDGHRQYHEAMIRAAEAQAAFWNELKLDVVKKGVWGMLIILLGLIMAGLAAKLGFAEIHALR